MPVPINIILPCYNPNETWHKELISFHKDASALYEISYIVVNDGSASKSVDGQVNELVAAHINLKYISYSHNKGKGYALRQGVLVSTAPLIVYTDIDFPFTNESTNLVLSTLAAGDADVVA